MLSGHYDLVVVGGGPAGYAAALYGSSAGLNVAIVERDRLGGTCLHAGCIPAKAFLEAASISRTVAAAPGFGVDPGGPPSIDFQRVQERKNAVVDTLFGGLVKLLKHRKITVVAGVGRLGADGVVIVSADSSDDVEPRDVELHGDHVVLAPGSRPRSIPGFEPDGQFVVDSDAIVGLSELPRSVAVIGGGVVGCEYASMFGDLGVQVTVLEAMPSILPGCDDDITRTVIRSFGGRNIAVRTGVEVVGHSPHGSGTTVKLGDGDELDVGLVVVAVGRQPNSGSLGLTGTGVEIDDRGFIVVDDQYRTGRDDVYAIGDVIATPALAHVAFAEGIFVVRDLLGENPDRIDNGKVPWCIYTHPEVAFSGLSEKAAKAAGREVVVSKHRFGGNSRALIIGEPDGMVKVIAEKCPDGSAGAILGVQMVGPWVTEQLGTGYLATNLGLAVDDLARFIQPHPTLGELFGESVLSLTGRSLHG